MTPQRDLDNIKKYYDCIRKWKQQCIDQGMTEGEFMELYNQTLGSLDTSRSDESENLNCTRRKKYVALLALSTSILLMAVNYKTIYSCLACTLQDYIYPSLRLLRKLFIPIISMFPSLTALYHETCLIQNPFFAVADMDCWPCSSVNNIMEVNRPKSVSEQHSAPFIYKTEQDVITPAILKQFYLEKKLLFDKEAPMILTDDKTYSLPLDMIRQQEIGEKHTYVWKFNNMITAKILRQIIPRPKVVPKFGQSTERFLIVDTSQKQFKISDTECNFSFLLSLSGSRTIVLNPAEECKHQCKALKIELKQTYLLWYNWWYWRPKVQPSTGNETFIAHVGSYC